MNRNRKGAMPEISRDLYKNVKKYDRQQFTQFCTDLYRFGYEDGKECVPGVDVLAVMEAIGKTRGIGEKKMEAIKASIEAVFTGGGES